MSADGPQFGFDPAAAADDMAVVVLHRTEGGCWQVESAQGSPEDIAAVVAAAVPAPQLPQELRERLAQGPSLADQVQEWLRVYAPEEFVLDAWQRHLIAAHFERNLADGRLWCATNATANGRWADVDETQAAALSPGRVPEHFERYYSSELLETVNAPADRRHHP